MSVMDALDREWHQLAANPRAAKEMAAACSTAGVRTLGELQSWMVAAAPADTDRVLLVLVGEAVAGSALALRVTLQLLQPGIRALIRRWSSWADSDERTAAVLAAVCHRIRHYPIATRPGKVAANVLLDAGQELSRRAAAGAVLISCDWDREADLESTSAVIGQDALIDRRPPAAAEELLSALVDAVGDGRLTALDAALVAETRVGGRRLASMVGEGSGSLRTLQRRRRAAERALVGTAA